MHLLETKQFLPIELEEAWEFFSSPANLKAITPEHMGFEILSGFRNGESMHAGMVIRYIVKPLLKLPMHWVTEITHVKAPHYFVDEQRFGPYSFWHHQHFFTAVEGGVEMRDVVHYKIPGGPIGKLANHFFIRRKVEEIFRYRYLKLESLFGRFQPSPQRTIRTS
ncbi:MAG: SRPBCC family protein [Bacteroidia bacterium]|nr:SRPBCC family protein [Bacteroidia bacterium]